MDPYHQHKQERKQPKKFSKPLAQSTTLNFESSQQSTGLPLTTTAIRDQIRNSTRTNNLVFFSFFILRYFVKKNKKYLEMLFYLLFLDGCADINFRLSRYTLRFACTDNISFGQSPNSFDHDSQYNQAILFLVDQQAFSHSL